jgi:hypothetical protein
MKKEAFIMGATPGIPQGHVDAVNMAHQQQQMQQQMNSNPVNNPMLMAALMAHPYFKTFKENQSVKPKKKVRKVRRPIEKKAFFQGMTEIQEASLDDMISNTHTLAKNLHREARGKLEPELLKHFTKGLMEEAGKQHYKAHMAKANVGKVNQGMQEMMTNAIGMQKAQK